MSCIVIRKQIDLFILISLFQLSNDAALNCSALPPDQLDKDDAESVHAGTDQWYIALAQR